MTRRLLAVHLYNDYSGSPRVLADQVSYWQTAGWSSTILTSNSEGMLSHIKGSKLKTFPYEFSPNKIIRLWRFLLAQYYMIAGVWQARREVDLVYINTLLPFGAALCAKMLGLPVIYHMHETSLRPHYFKLALRKVAQYCSTATVYVSKFLAETEELKGTPSYVIYNSLPADFLTEANVQRELFPKSPSTFTSLMACSLKDYKGVHQFVDLAERLPEYHFKLVLNADIAAINNYFNNRLLPDNLIIFPAQRDMHWFYQRADLVLNLSLPDQWVETFGLTLLEAFAYGKPVIGPPVGGPTEVIDHGQNGFTTSAYALDDIAEQIAALATNHELREQFKKAALEKVQFFDRANIQQQVKELLDQIVLAPPSRTITTVAPSSPEPSLPVV